MQQVTDDTLNAERRQTVRHAVTARQHGDLVTPGEQLVKNV